MTTWLWTLLNVFFLQKTDFRRWFSLSSLLSSVIFLFVFIGPCCFVVFQYCCEMLNMESLCKVKGVHILFLFTTFPLFSWTVSIQATFKTPCIKEGRHHPLVFCSWSSVAMQLTSPLASFCCKTVCNVFSLSTAISWKEMKGLRGLTAIFNVMHFSSNFKYAVCER